MTKQKPSLNQADVNLLKKTFATKDDLKPFATKDDVKGIVKNQLKPIKKDLKDLEQRTINTFLTKDEFYDFNEKLDVKLTKHRSDLMNTLDKILKEILSSREAQKILNERTSNHETRITDLEEIHPQGKHAFA